MMKKIVIILFCSLSLAFVYGQGKKKKQKKSSSAKKTAVLFTVNNEPVRSEEFIYLYNKNHQSKPDEYTEASILEYLDLFINFKVKVAEAKHRGMDTTQAFIKEYTSYRNELLKPYLPDTKIIDSLVTLTYNRLKEEVRASHILIKVPADAPPADTLAAYRKIMALKKRIEEGEDFGELATAHSEDESARMNHGDLGYFTALRMVYPFETAAYTTPVGQVSNPFRTQFGYHLVTVVDRQPSRGEVEVSHIMIRTGPGKDATEAKNLIFNIYDQLTAGAPWDELCRQFSEDQSSKEQGGRLRPFGVGVMAAVPEFEKAAFALKEPGDLSDPIKTAYGWHIIRLEKKTELPPLSEIEAELKSRVAKSDRLQVSKEAWQEKLRRSYKFSENQAVKERVMALADSSLTQAAWRAPAYPQAEKEMLFSLQGQGYPVSDFLAYVEKNQTRGLAPAVSMDRLYTAYVDSCIMALLEKKIAEENPDFGMLLNEYYEGILLFEIMEDEIWNKAAEDTAGLHLFYDKNKSAYKAEERANTDLYSAATNDFVPELKTLINQHDTTKIKQYAALHKLRHEVGLYEKADKAVFSKAPWQTGIYSAETNGMYYLAWIHSIQPPGLKTFDEARAAVIADYQQELEETWIAALKKKYPVKINEKSKRYVLEKLTK